MAFPAAASTLQPADGMALQADGMMQQADGVTQPADGMTLQADSVGQMEDMELHEVTVTARRAGTVKSRGLLNAATITGAELTKAACCNLGESFSTNPSVDVNYSDAATGAKQIRLLGLSGTYVQMMTENIPNYRGAAAPYALGYTPGPWMQSIQVSKGASEVKHGYESMTGQINIGLLKPEADERIGFNMYGNTMGRVEVNADANVHLTGRLSTGVMAHYEDAYGSHDGNGDGFLDEPKVRQYNLRNNWVYMGQRYIFHGYLIGLKESRNGGQAEGHVMAGSGTRLFGITTETERYEAGAKNAFILDSEHNTNIALILSGTLHTQDAAFGMKTYGVNQKNFYSSLMFETEFTDMHSLSAGLSLNHDYYKEHLYLPGLGADGRWTAEAGSFRGGSMETETTPGAYLQYTFNYSDKIVVMGGLRVDHSNIYGTFVTPRAHIKYAPNDIVSVRASVGKGYRTVHALAENNYLLASGRRLVTDGLNQEAAWNYGLSTTLYIPLLGKTLNVNAEYYYTDFERQVITDYDSNAGEIRITNLQGRSYSHTWQVDASYPVVRGMTLTAAYRRTDVKVTYGGRLMEKPLTGRYKGLITASYKTPLGLWQADATLQLNGGGRMPEPYTLPDGSLSWDRRFGGYGQLNAQLTRWFRKFSVYIGGENLTNFKQKTPIINASDPWSDKFDPTMVWGPVQGAMAYVGVRFEFNS